MEEISGSPSILDFLLKLPPTNANSKSTNSKISNKIGKSDEREREGKRSDVSKKEKRQPMTKCDSDPTRSLQRRSSRAEMVVVLPPAVHVSNDWRIPTMFQRRARMVKFVTRTFLVEPYRTFRSTTQAIMMMMLVMRTMMV